MYFKDDTRHHTPHFHAWYSGEEAVFDFDGNILEGSFPRRQTKFVAAWAELRREELEALWKFVCESKEYFKIKGLE